MKPVAVAIFCKTPSPGHSKTRLSPPLNPDECSQLSACFIRDLSMTIAQSTADGFGAPFAVYTPAGSEAALRLLLPETFTLHLQGNGDFGSRLLQASTELLAAGHAGVILVNSDSPTLPVEMLRQAIAAVRSQDAVVIGPAIDGGYTLIGLSRLHPHLFADIPWSTDEVYRATRQRADEIGLPVIEVGRWYDVDDAQTLRLLEAELAGTPPPFATKGLIGAAAPSTRAFLEQRAVTRAAR